MSFDSIFWYAVGASLFFGGSVTATVRSAIKHRDDKRRERIEGPQPVCGCGHHFSYHNTMTGACHQQQSHVTKWDGGGIARSAEVRDCACQVYAGPQPVQAFYAPPITSATTPDTMDRKLAQIEKEQHSDG